MFRNYFKTAWRILNRNKMYSIINVLGLSLGISACIIIYLIANHDLSFDRFHPDASRIYRIVGELQNKAGEKMFLNSPIPEVSGFQTQIPGFEATTGFHLYGEDVTIPGRDQTSKKFSGRTDRPGSWQAASILTGPQYFDIFKYQWLVGNAQSLREPYKVVLSQKRAIKYFGDLPLNQIIGKTVLYQDSLRVSVSGIVKDWQDNTDFGYTDFISLSTATHSFLKSQIPTEDWTSLSPHRSMAFVKLAPGTTAAQVNKRFASFIKQNVKIDNPGLKVTMQLQPLGDIHFTKEFHRGDDGDNFDKLYPPTLYALIGVALFILVIAIVNFVNLSTAQSLKRAKEIGVRKVLGSGKNKLAVQFLVETGMVTTLSIITSVFLIKPLLGLFSSYIPQGITFHPIASGTVLFLLSVLIVTTLLAGFYPAKVLSSYVPILTLKGDVMQKGSDKINLRKALIVFQFTISLTFIIGVIVIGKQMRFMNNADKGFNSDSIITAYNWGDHSGKLGIFAEGARHINGVRNAILEGTDPMGFAQNVDFYQFKEKEEDRRQVLSDIGTKDFIPFYGIKIIAGRNMAASDSLNELVINETFARSLGFTKPLDAIGKLLYKQSGQAEKAYPIVGVVADYHTSSFHETIKPLVIEHVPDRLSSVAIKLVGRNKKTIAKLEALWKKLFPEIPFNYNFLTESIARLFEQEQKTAWLMNVAMGITIFISCMGLFGLSMYTAERRKKEIGIRKVLGATVANIATMLSKDFIKLICIAGLISSPIAWFFSNQWLQDFAYRTNISWWVFIVAGLAGVLVSLIGISFQSISAAIANPVKSLRTE